ncbi:MAG: spermidine/putrescine ABC transporter substrate-binding protein, partial [Treponema sp.]|nr:spermidine/putrescine ABC transporter substrate-binding protein [Treponema sp.]
MKKIRRKVPVVGVALAAALLFPVLGWAGGRSDPNRLYIYNWTYYTPDSVIEKFEQEYGVTVYYDEFASNEDMYAKIKA